MMIWVVVQEIDAGHHLGGWFASVPAEFDRAGQSARDREDEGAAVAQNLLDGGSYKPADPDRTGLGGQPSLCVWLMGE